jgi:hypothetical protein
MRYGETGEKYNIRMSGKTYSTFEQTLGRSGTTAPPGSALQRAMDSSILRSNLGPMITGMTDEQSNVQTGEPTPMSVLKNEYVRRRGGRTKKNKRA